MSIAIDTSIRSPNHSSRQGRAITMVVVHATAGSLASALSWLTSPAARVSANYVVAKDGRVLQLVPDELAAWHAGRAAWRGNTAINEISLGIEVENANDGHDPYPPVQLAALVELVRSKVAQYGIEPYNVVRHLDVAIPRGRKNDPAGFNWGAFRDRVFGVAPPAPGTTPYRTRAQVWVRSRPAQAPTGVHVATIAKGEPVTALAVIEGAFVRNTWGASNLWAQTDAGYIWLPQLEAL